MTTTQIMIQEKYAVLGPLLDERTRRIWAATEAEALGYGGVTLVHRATGLACSTIHQGRAELANLKALPAGRIRKSGGGRKKIVEHDPLFPEKLEKLVEPLTRGDPESPLRWTCKSTRRLADELKKQGTFVGVKTVARQLRHMDYSLQGNRKTEEGQKKHPDRNAQFEHINRLAEITLKSSSPVISVDTKKKELVGNYKNNGQQWHKQGKAPAVLSHDFPDPDVPRAFPYGIFDIGRNEGFVNVGSDHDTSAFAAASIRVWWNQVGSRVYPKARHIQVMADSGGSNGYRRRTWKWELQRLADDTGLPIRVCHFPPGTSKWNKVEHRLFSFISQNWRGEPLTSYETIVKLIAATKTKTGLKVECQLDMAKYPLGQEVSKEDWRSMNLHPDPFHGDWNYEIRPRETL